MASAMWSEGNLGTRALVVPLEGPSEGGRRADHGEVSPPLPSMDGRFLVDCSNQSIGAVVVGKGTAPTIASRGTPTPSRICARSHARQQIPRTNRANESLTPDQA